MAQTKKQKQQKALENLTSVIVEQLGNGVSPTRSQREEYNNLKKSLGLEGRLF